MITKELLECLREERIQIQIHYVEKTNSFKLAFRRQFPISKVAYTSVAKDYYVPGDDILVSDEEWETRMKEIQANFVRFVDENAPDKEEKND